MGEEGAEHDEFRVPILNAKDLKGADYKGLDKPCQGGKTWPLPCYVLWLGLRIKLTYDTLTGEKHKHFI